VNSCEDASPQADLERVKPSTQLAEPAGAGVTEPAEQNENQA
jgi:hypothetical protein